MLSVGAPRDAVWVIASARRCHTIVTREYTGANLLANNLG